MQEIVCKNEEQTMEIASKLASQLKKGDVIILTGELGAGKTKFVEGVLSYFNIQDEISSPTFTIVNEYYANDVNIYHFDLYRLSEPEEFEAIGGFEYFEKGISILEWGELIEEILPDEFMKITFEKDDQDTSIRKLKIEYFGERYKEIKL